MASKARKTIIWFVLLAITGLVCWAFARGRKQEVPITFSGFMQEIGAGKIKEVSIRGSEVHGTYANQKTGFRATVPNYPDLYKVLLDKSVTVDYQPSESANWTSGLLNLAPLAVVVLLCVFLVRQLQAGGQKVFSFGKSKARLATSPVGGKQKTTFKDIAGATEAKIALQELVEFLKNPKMWNGLGAKPPKGCLLVGPPGCGKTLLARAVAGEAGVSFYTASGAEFVELFVGVGASRIRDLFQTCQASAPCILFLDELDAIGRLRGSGGFGGAHEEREQTLNQLLNELDGFDGTTGIVVIAATNRPDVLDKALVRPGRFDRQINVPLPTTEERADILAIHTRNKPLGADIDFALLAPRLQGYSGADLENLANQAAMEAIRRSRTQEPKDAVIMEDFNRAFEIMRSGRTMFATLDVALTESATQLSQPIEKLYARLHLYDMETVEAEVLWVDAAFIKYKDLRDGAEAIVSKYAIRKFEPIRGLGSASVSWNPSLVRAQNAP